MFTQVKKRNKNNISNEKNIFQEFQNIVSLSEKETGEALSQYSMKELIQFTRYSTLLKYPPL